MSEFKSGVFELNRVYTQKIIKVSNERRRTFKRPGTDVQVYVFDVFTEDANGKYISEYLSEDPEIHPFKIGELQTIKCVVAGRRTDEIELVADGVLSPKQIVNLSKQVSIAGTSYAIAFSAAIQLYAGKLQCSPDMEIDDDLLNKICTTADDFNVYLMAKMEPNASEAISH